MKLPVTELKTVLLLIQQKNLMILIPRTHYLQMFQMILGVRIEIKQNSYDEDEEGEG